MANKNNDADIVQRTRFMDKWFCDMYATLVLFEYIHNPDLRKLINCAMKSKAIFRGKELCDVDSFIIATSGIMLGLNRQIYPVVERMEAEEF